MKTGTIFWVVFVSMAIVSCQIVKKGSITEENEFTGKDYDRILFYNTENLFDTIDQPDVRDEEFTPNSDKHWTSFRYYKKLQDIAKVIMAIGGNKPPTLIGLAEIENHAVLEDLIWRTPLKKVKYRIIHKESPDRRGIDVALLYNPKRFVPVYYSFIKIVSEKEPDLRTREILYAKGLLGKDTLHVFVNHWPSRYGGKEQSEWRRVLAASYLKHAVDSIIHNQPTANIIIIGDFNDEPTDKSISEILGASNYVNDSIYLFNLVADLDKQGKGSYRYRQEWNMIDQIIVSKAMIEGKSLKVSPAYTGVFSEDWMLVDEKKYTGKKPFRTYYGPFYNGGLSDHLPVYTDIFHKK